MTTFSERLIILRGDLAQDEFSAKFGIPQRTYSRYEQGTNFPKVDTVQTICQVLKVSPSWLLLGEGPQYLQASINNAVLDISVLKRAIQIVEDGLAESKKHLDTAKKVSLFVTVYEFLLDDSENDSQHIIQILKTIS